MARMKLLKRMIVVLLVITAGIAATKSFYIDVKKCTQCGICVDACEEAAIVSTKKDGKNVHAIDGAKCTGCGVCVEECPEGAIREKTVEKKKL